MMHMPWLAEIPLPATPFLPPLDTKAMFKIKAGDSIVALES
jgi:hypothetical protein